MFECYIIYPSIVYVHLHKCNFRIYRCSLPPRVTPSVEPYRAAVTNSYERSVVTAAETGLGGYIRTINSKGDGELWFDGAERMMEATRSGYVPKHAGMALMIWLVCLCSPTASLRDTFFFLGKVSEW